MIAKAPAGISISNTTVAFDGTPRAATVTTTPAGLPVLVTYNGSTTAPSAAGSYAVIATINDPNYQGTANALLVLTLSTVLDQAFEVIAGSQPFGQTNRLAQTITAARTGQLMRIDVPLTDRPDNQAVILTFFRTAQGVPITTAPLASKVFTIPLSPTYANNGSYTWRELDVSDLNVSFAAGETFAVELSGSTPFVYFFSWMLAEGYVRGERYNTTTAPVLAGFDHAFRTYVRPNAPTSPASVELQNLTQGFNATPRPVMATTVPTGLPVALAYDGRSTAPTNAGSYPVVATITDPGYTGTAAATLTITKAAATVALSNIAQVSDGSPKPVTVLTVPTGIPVTVTYNGSATPPSAIGVYSVTATITDPNYLGSATGALVLNPPALVIVYPPADATVIAGQPATFTVIATSGSPITYQWRKGTTNIPGATAATLTIPNTQPADAGSYRVVVTDPTRSITSPAVPLTVLVPPVITAQPQNDTINIGQNATFSVTATGTGPLTYLWRKNGVDLAGATARTLQISNATPGHEGLYSVVITGPGGVATSANARLTVNVPPAITAQPTSVTSGAGGTVKFSVVATGTAPLGYQWRKGSTNLPGATMATLTLPNVQPADAGTYRVVVSNAGGSLTSAAATLTVVLDPTITVQPLDETVTAGQAATFTVTATGTTPFLYQWRKDGVNIPGATSRTLQIPKAAPTDEGDYSVVVSNFADSSTSADATLTVNVPPVVTTSPVSVAAITGNSVSFTVAATGTAPLAYQWRKGSTNIAGATSSTFTIANVQSTDAATYRVVVSNAGGSDTSDPATLTVYVPPTIAQQPQDRTVNAGQSATFSVTAAGSTPYSYQWRKTNGAFIPGGTSRTLQIANATPADEGSYQVTITSPGGTVTSVDARLSVIVPPAITTQPVGVTVTAGGTANFSVVATGTVPLTYQWRRGTTNLAGATAATFTLTNVQAVSAGTYRVVVSNAAGSITSAAVQLTVK